MASQAILVLGSLAAGLAGHFMFTRLVGAAPPGVVYIAVTATALVIAGVLLSNAKTRQSLPQGAWGVAALLTLGTVLALANATQLAAYLRLPVDLVSFAESPFVNDILKFRLGVPIYTPPGDNNSYPYTPGAPILTYLISAALGHPDSIPFFRHVQFAYVLVACLIGASVCHLLARALLSEREYKNRLWTPVWFLFIFLLATDRRFNLYTHSLHNDGLALLVSVTAYWLIVKHSLTRSPWLIVSMAVLPALGFLAKQNQLMWAGVFLVYLLAVGGVPLRQVGSYVFGAAVSIGAAVGTCYWLWGDNFLWWVFTGLGSKQVSLFRVAQHLLDAGIYAMMGLFAGWVLVLRNGSRRSAAIWLAWMMPFGIQTYTTGVAWVANHLGPGVVLSACWFFVALLRIWPVPEGQTFWRYRLQEAVAVSLVFLLFGALGLVREPRSLVPSDFYRYVADIEREFQGTDPRKVLLDNGTWVYLKDNILMKDRSSPVSLHVGKNQPEINREALAATIRRIEQRTYDKILVREIFTDQSAYDYQDRGSGVKAAILANYVEARRIPGVRGVREWWPLHMIAEISVMVPNGEAKAPANGR
jgi:hypothetical protein